MVIKPSTCLRNEYNDIAEFCKTENQPVFLTKMARVILLL